jgi:phosphatidate cytidylyltransferase
LAVLAGWEYLGLAERCGAKPPRIATMTALVLLFAVNLFWPDSDLTPAIFGILSLGLLVYCTFFKPVEDVIANASSSIFCLVYTGLTLLALPALRQPPYGSSPILLFLLIAVWSGDTAAYYVGKKWGQHKLIPKLSPGKTWEGTVASLVGSVLAAGLLVELGSQMQEPWNSSLLTWLERACPSVVLSYPDEIWYWLLLAALVNVAAQVGDLAESALKRSAGVKDSGTLLPGHGGVLDRIDALLLAAPVLWYAQMIHLKF